MNYFKKAFVFLGGLVFLCNPAFSQVTPIQNPVTWNYIVKKTANSDYELIFQARIRQPWHIYSQFLPTDVVGPVPTSFTFNPSASYKLIGKAEERSRMISEYDSNFNMMLKYYVGEAIFVQKIRTNGHADKITGSLEFMTCDNKQCLAPETRDFVFQVGEKPDLAAKDTAVNKTASDKETKIVVKTEEQPPVDTKAHKGLWAFILFALSQGLISLITPCVFPMIPMTVSFFTHNEKKKAKGIFNALVFGFSIILLFIVLGIIFGLIFGEDTSHEISTHWLPNVFFFLIFMIFAASFLGMFEITLPSWLINRVDKQADKGGFFGPFFMAFTTVLVSFSCTGPLVANVVALAKNGDVFKSVIGMLAYGLAFATPFTLFAIFPKWLSSLPKSGGWLNSVKVFLGFLELALGMKFLSVADQAYHWHLLDRDVYLAIWIVIFALLGFYLIGKLRLSHDSEVKHVSVPRLLLAILVFSFVIYLIPGMFGAPLKVLAGYLPPQHTQSFDLMSMINQSKVSTGNSADQTLCDKPKYADFLELPHGLKGYFDYQQALDCAKDQNKPVFIDFTGHSCVNCREMEARVWSDPRVLKMLKNEFVVVSLFVDDKTRLPKNDWVLSKHDGKWKKNLGKKYADLEVAKYGYNAQPYYELVNYKEERLVEPRAYDLDVEAYIKWLESALKKFKEIHKTDQ